MTKLLNFKKKREENNYNISGKEGALTQDIEKRVQPIGGKWIHLTRVKPGTSVYQKTP